MNELYEERRYLIPFRATLLPQIFTDVLVIGTGVGGLRAAMAAAEHAEVIVTGKGSIKHSSTYWAQGGVAAVMSDVEDSLEEHARDTLQAGAGLCDEPAVQRLVEAGPQRVRELIDWGMPFDTQTPSAGDVDPGIDRADDRKTLALGREGGHSRFRILHAEGDATGRALAQTLHRKVHQTERIRLFDQCFVLDLVTLEGSGRCVGAITHHPKYGLQVIWARATVLASGGCGQLFRESTNPSSATGDGHAMAYRAGAQMADMAFMQFHPTTLYVAGASRALITEAVRGEGAHLIDRQGYRFMPDYDERAELAPRDVVARSILTQIEKTNHSHVFLDCRHLDAEGFRQRFPGICALLSKFELDPAKTPIPIHPSAHYMIGGVVTDLDGRTSVPGLYACGEVTCTGLNGANRLASNSLLEGLVFGEAAGRTCSEMIAEENGPYGPVKVISDIRPSDRSELDLSDVRSSVRSVMWRHVGVLREGDRLGEVLEMFDFWGRYTLDKIFDEKLGWETQNMLLVGVLMTRAARWRAETRGTHSRTDCPEPREEYRLHELWQRGQQEPHTRPVQTLDAGTIVGGRGGG
jgi:L-aspartate oxidase